MSKTTTYTYRIDVSIGAVVMIDGEVAIQRSKRLTKKEAREILVRNWNRMSLAEKFDNTSGMSDAHDIAESTLHQIEQAAKAGKMKTEFASQIDEDIDEEEDAVETVTIPKAEYDALCKLKEKSKRK